MLDVAIATPGSSACQNSMASSRKHLPQMYEQHIRSCDGQQQNCSRRPDSTLRSQRHRHQQGRQVGLLLVISLVLGHLVVHSSSQPAPGIPAWCSLQQPGSAACASGGTACQVNRVGCHCRGRRGDLELVTDAQLCVKDMCYAVCTMSLLLIMSLCDCCTSCRGDGNLNGVWCTHPFI